MIKLRECILEGYSGTMEILFYVFLFCTLTFGRSFSALYINMPFLPLFVTEIFLVLNLPLLLYKDNNLTSLPKIFLISFLTFFCAGCFYLVFGLLKYNIFAVRDITLFAYMLFLPVTFINLNSLNKIKFFIAVVIISNILSLFLRWGLSLQAYPLEAFYNFVSKTKTFNLGLYYGIVISIIVSFYDCIKPKVHRLVTLIVLSLFIVAIIRFSISSIWVATLLLFVSLFIILRVKFLKVFVALIPVFIFTNLIVLYFMPSFYKASIFNEAKGFYLISQGIPRPGESMKTLSAVKAVSDSVSGPGESMKTPSMVKAVSDSVSGSGELMNEHSESQAVFANIAWRFGIWKQTLKFASDSLLFGKGFGVYPVYEIWGTYQYPHGVHLDSGIVPAHNHIVTVFLKMGILGLGLFLYINFFFFFYALSYLNKCNIRFLDNSIVALLGAFVFWHTLALFFDVIDSPPTSIFLWVIMGAIFAAIKIDKDFLSNKSIYKERMVRHK